MRTDSPRGPLLAVTAVLLAAWLAGAGMMWAASGGTETDPAGRMYGRNWPGDLQNLIKTSLCEIVLLWLVLRPWSFNRSWGRVLAAAALFTPYVALRMLAGMHGGPIISAHDIWLALLWLGMLTAAPVIWWRRRRARR